METVEVRWRDKRNELFVARLSFERIGERLEVVEVAVHSPKWNRIIDGRVLRDLRVAEVAADGLRQLRNAAVAAQLDPGLPLNAGDLPADSLRRRAAMYAELKRRGEKLEPLIGASLTGPGRRYPVGHLERVAEIYTLARQRHDPPTKAVAQTFGISPGAAKKQVYRARSNGLLPATTQGKAEGRRPATQNRRKKS